MIFQKRPAYRLVFPIILLCFFCTAKLFAATIEKCDAIIVSGVEALNRGEHVKSLELLTQARIMADNKGWYKQQFLAINNIGANYYMLLEYGEALNYYLEAYTIALKQLEPKYEMIVLNNIAILYSKEKKFNKANEYFRKAYDIAKENKDFLKVGLYAMNMGNVANETGNSKLARSYFSEAIPLLADQPQFLILAKIGLADCDLSEGNTFKARNIAGELLRTTKDLDFNDIGISLLLIISKSWLKENNPDQANEYAKKIMMRNPNLETRITVFELLSEINFKRKSFREALAFKDSIILANKEFNEIKDGKLFENGKVKFEIKNYQNEIALKESRLENERKIFYSVIAAIIIIVFFIVWTLRNLSIKHKQRKLIAERNEQILALELEKEKSELLLLEKQLNENQAISLLEQERLKNEVEMKNRKLSAKALYLSGRNQMIGEVISELSELPQVSGDTALVSHIQALKNHLKTDNEWDSFITHFEEVNQHFLTALKSRHPNLTSNDIRFISYIYMNLSTKEIASMLNIAPESCRKRKERISSKMGLPEGTSLYDYLALL
jgi:tetratricopeptide (TPR) repeat protein